MVNLIPTKEFRKKILENEMKAGTYHVCITTYDALIICKNALWKRKFNYAVFDEAHKMKNDLSKMTVIARKLNTSNRLLLTGTPL